MELLVVAILLLLILDLAALYGAADSIDDIDSAEWERRRNWPAIRR